MSSNDVSLGTEMKSAGSGRAVAAETAEAEAIKASVAVAPPGDPVPIRLIVNGEMHMLSVDVRTTLLDALRENLDLTGTKKGCDHGQCGACTVHVEGRRINACLSLAVMHDGDAITTIEGLGTIDRLHPLQRAFIEQDGFQCGYCTPGQIMSAAAMLEEARSGMPSHATNDLVGAAALDDAEIRERMSGNLCRCAAYPNIVAAIRSASGLNSEGAGA